MKWLTVGIYPSEREAVEASEQLGKAGVAAEVEYHLIVPASQIEQAKDEIVRQLRELRRRRQGL